MDRAILARHGESVFSARRYVNGDITVAVPLTERGIAEAKRLGEQIDQDEIDLCVTSEFERTQQTADIALAGRDDVPRVAIPELNDPRYGRYEGGPLDAYLEWAHAHGSRDVPPGDGETRNALAARYATGFRKVLERPERTVLVVAHSLPLAYVLMAVSGRDPAAKADLVEHAKPYRLTRDEVERAVERIEAWCGDPTW